MWYGIVVKEAIYDKNGLSYYKYISKDFQIETEHLINYVWAFHSSWVIYDIKNCIL